MIFTLEFDYSYGQSWPLLEFDQKILEVQEEKINSHVKKVLFTIDVQKFPCVILNINKKETDTVVENNTIIRDQIVTLKNIWAENILLDKHLLLSHTSFVPEYHSGYLSYCKQHNIVVENVLQCYGFYFNGKFNLNFELPFWNWYEQIRKEKHSNLSQQQINLYVGQIGKEQFASLQKLKDLLSSV